MKNKAILLVTSLAPIIWGSSYIVATEWLPKDFPLTIALLRALPAGLILLLLCRELPNTAWLGKIFILGGLNFAVFWWLLFVSAYRLPGGVAATLGSIQPLIVILAARIYLSIPISISAMLGAGLGILGVALLLLNSQAQLDVIGITAGVAGALSMALGTVLSKKWFIGQKQAHNSQILLPQVTPLALTAWQLVAGGMLLIPFAVVLEPSLPPLTVINVLAISYLGLIGAAVTYVLWFRGLAKLSPTNISPLGFLSPLSAVFLGWVLLNQQLTLLQICGALTVLFSVWLSQQQFTKVRAVTNLKNV